MRRYWQAIQDDLAEEIGSAQFNTWIKPLKVASADERSLTLRAPNPWYKDWITTHYLANIQRGLRSAVGTSDITVKVISDDSPECTTEPLNKPQKPVETKKHSEKSLSIKTAPAHGVSCGLNPKYVFPTFVVGPSNQFAHAASQAVADRPGKTYNPLFIYGGVGLGKTHLLNAIGNRILEKNPAARIFYKSAEQFMNELITCLRNKSMTEFRNRYRTRCDVLLIDDIQFLAGKETTQEEFFHTFNVLHEMGKQIVVTSDKFPKEIPDLEERLRSRFEWGLIADIQPPEIETRIAILKKKAETSGIYIPDSVAQFLAQNVRSNIRELEGSLIRLEAYASLHGVPINEQLAKEVLKQLIVEQKPITVEDIQKTVASFFNIKISDLKSSRKQKVIALPRQIAMYLARKHTDCSYPEIGMKFGGKDHTTIIHAVKKIERMAEKEASIRNTIESIEKNLSLLQN